MTQHPAHRSGARPRGRQRSASGRERLDPCGRSDRHSSRVPATQTLGGSRCGSRPVDPAWSARRSWLTGPALQGGRALAPGQLMGAIAPGSTGHPARSWARLDRETAVSCNSGLAPHTWIGGSCCLTAQPVSASDSSRSARTGAKRGPDAPQVSLPGGARP